MSRKRKFGDRKDGWLLRSLAPIEKITPFFMKTRQDASNKFTDKADITEVEKYLKDKRAEGYPGMGMLHLFVAAYVRAVSQRPALNRFISGQRIYARNNIEVIMSIKPSMDSESVSTSLKVEFAPTDTIFDVYNKMKQAIEETRKGDTDLDAAAGAFAKLPRPILKLIMSCLRSLDYFGWLPKSLTRVSPFHGSIVFVDIGSVGIPVVFHHLYDFGNVPLFLSFGSKQTEHVLNADGSVTQRKYINYALTLDERICDGFYFGTAFKYLRSFLRAPTTLDVPPEQVFSDID